MSGRTRMWGETGLLRDARRLDKRMNIKGWISCTNRQDTPGISLHIFPSKAQDLLTRNEIRPSLIKRTSFINVVYLYPAARKRAGRRVRPP